MKRFVLPLLFVVVAGFVACALPIYEDPNVTWITPIDATTGWLTVMNAGATSQSFLRIAASSEIAIEDGFTAVWDGTYLTVALPEAVAAGGDVVTLKLASVGGSAIELLGAELGVFGGVWSAVADGTSAVVTVLNAGATDVTKVVVNSYTYMADVIEGFDNVLAQLGGTQLVITLATPLAPGQAVTLKIDAAADAPAVHIQSVKLY